LKEFGGDPSIVGKQLRMDGQSATVIGVLEPAPFYPNRADALMNMVISPHHTSALMVQGRTHRMTTVVARLAPGATLQQARAEVGAVHARMQREYKESYDPGSHFRAAVIPYKEVLGESARTTIWLLMAAALFVMIIAAANVVNLTLMRGVRREQELVVRAALGAGTMRLRRLLLAENLVLTLLGALLGLVLAMAGVRVLVALAQRYSPRAGEIRLDTVVLAFMLALAIAVALLLSFVASLPREGAFASWIAAGTRRTSGSVRKQRLQRALVIAQIAVSVVLLAGAGLLTRTMIRLSEVRTGLETEDVLSMRVPLVSFAALDSAADAVAKQQYERMRVDLATLPGVIDVGLGSNMPLEGDGLGFDLKVESRPLEPGEAIPRASLRTANPQYFEAAGIPLVSGRAFTDADRLGSEKVVIINQTLAKSYFPNESPIGKRVAWTGDVLRFTPFTSEWRTIVGVSSNTQDGGMDAQPVSVVYMPFAQEVAISGTLVLRSSGDPSALALLATRHVHTIAPDAPIQDVKTVAQIKDQSVAPRRLNAELISLFGALAVVVAAVGIAGVLAFSVSARANEIGIRMSLGADRGRVQRMILGEGGVLLGVGLGVGVAVAFFVARVIRGLLFGVAPHDPTTFVTVAAMMTAIGVIACWIPANRASRIDPAIAMRA
jgi:predicted permease